MENVFAIRRIIGGNKRKLKVTYKDALRSAIAKDEFQIFCHLKNIRITKKMVICWSMAGEYGWWSMISNYSFFYLAIRVHFANKKKISELGCFIASFANTFQRLALLSLRYSLLFDQTWEAVVKNTMKRSQNRSDIITLADLEFASAHDLVFKM